MAQPLALGALSITPRVHNPFPRVKQDRPAYGVGGKGFFDDKDKLWYPGQALYFNGEPNMDLTPLNKKAYDCMQAFLDKLDEAGEKKAKKDGRAYVRIVREEWREEGEEGPEIPQPEFVMGSRKEGSNEIIR